MWLNHVCHTCEWIMSHIWTSHVTYLNQPCHISKRVMSQIMSHFWKSHVTHLNESCHISEQIMSHIWMRHVTHLNASWHTGSARKAVYQQRLLHPQILCNTSEWVMSHIWMHPYLNESYHTSEWVMSHIWMHPHLNESYHSHLNEWCYAGSEREAVYQQRLLHPYNYADAQESRPSSLHQSHGGTFIRVW